VKAQCSVDSCERTAKAHGMCGAHVERAREGRPLVGPIAVTRPAFGDRYVAVNSGCWEWQGWLNGDGYGTHRKQPAHRFSYELHIGPIPDGLVIDHLCRNPRCVNPEHLEAVTTRINTMRGVSPGAKAARTNRCKRGHEFTPENTYSRTLATGGPSRQCLACRRERHRERREPAA
jgi:hypothetical protein